MQIISIDANSPAGPTLVVEILPEESNIADFPHSVDIAAVPDLANAGTTREDRLLARLDELGITAAEPRAALVVAVNENLIDIVRFVADGDG